MQTFNLCLIIYKGYHSCHLPLSVWVTRCWRPRLCVAALLKCRLGKFLATFALRCASWTPINRGTSCRAPCGSLGFMEYFSVSDSNMLGSRILIQNKYRAFSFICFILFVGKCYWDGLEFWGIQTIGPRIYIYIY